MVTADGLRAAWEAELAERGQRFDDHEVVADVSD